MENVVCCAFCIIITRAGGVLSTSCSVRLCGYCSVVSRSMSGKVNPIFEKGMLFSLWAERRRVRAQESVWCVCVECSASINCIYVCPEGFGVRDGGLSRDRLNGTWLLWCLVDVLAVCVFEQFGGGVCLVFR